MLRPLLALAFMAAGFAHAADTFEFKNEPGPHAVGLKVVQQYDRSRVYKPRVSLVTGQPTSGERARPMQMLVWYPAGRNGGKRVTFEDYLATQATEDDFTLDTAAVQHATAGRIAERKAIFPHAAKVLARPMWAVKNAPEAPGKFPVVVYAPSFSATASENADLCEYLASHGYLVLASSSLVANSRSMTDDIEGVEAQAGDIAYLISHASNLPQADTSKIAVAGFSWGGLANIAAAARDDRIKALVALDGSVRYYPQLVDGGKEAIRYVSPARLPVPLLYFAQRPRSIEALNQRGKSTSYSLLNQMVYSDVLVATMHPMEHANFAADGLRFTPDAAFDEYTRDEVNAAYQWMSRYTLRFLDAYLKGDGKAAAFLANKPGANGVPPHMISLDVRRGSGSPPTRENFVAQLAARGFEHAFAAYNEIQKRGATFKLQAHDINSWGYELLRAGKLKESIAIFRFGTELEPSDANLYDSLGEAQAAAGLRDDAIRNYRRSLELNPKNANAVERLKALNAGQG